MPIAVGMIVPPQPAPDPEAMNIQRILTITAPDGTQVVIRTAEELQRILDSMTPEQIEAWKTNYRFTPIRNSTGNYNYTGTVIDTL